MRKLPCYFVCDRSGSMFGAPITALKAGLDSVPNILMNDGRLVESLYISLITFNDSSSQDLALTKLDALSFPDFSAEGETAMGGALQFCAECIDAEVSSGTARTKGDFTPIVFLFSDGAPTDDFLAGKTYLEKNKYRPVLVAIGVGPNADMNVMRQIAPERVYHMSSLDSAAWLQLFSFVSIAITSIGNSIAATGNSTGFVMPTPPAGIQQF